MSGDPFAMIPGGAADADLDGLAFRVLIVLGSRATKDRYVWVTQKALANRLGVTRQAVGKAIERLVRARLLVRAGHYVEPGSNRWRNRYYVPLYLHVATTGRIVADETPHDATLDVHDATVAIHDAQSQARMRARNRPYESDPMKQRRAKDATQQPPEEAAASTASAEEGGDMEEQEQERTEEQEPKVINLHRRPRALGSDEAKAAGLAFKARHRESVGDGPEPQPRSREEQIAALRRLAEEER